MCQTRHVQLNAKFPTHQEKYHQEMLRNIFLPILFTNLRPTSRALQMNCYSKFAIFLLLIATTTCKHCFGRSRGLFPLLQSTGICSRKTKSMAAKVKPYLNIQCDWTEILRQATSIQFVRRLQSLYMFITLQEFWRKSLDIVLKKG